MIQRFIQRLRAKGIGVLQSRLGFNGVTQIHQHHHAKLGRHPRQGDKPGSRRHRHMEPLPVEEPDAAHQRKRQAHQDQQCFIHPTEGQIEQDEDNHHRHRHHQLELLIGMLQQLKLPGKRHAGARLQRHAAANRRLQVMHDGDHIAVAGVDVNPARRARILGFQHRRAGNHLHLRHVAEGDLLLRGRENR